MQPVWQITKPAAAIVGVEAGLAFLLTAVVVQKAATGFFHNVPVQRHAGRAATHAQHGTARSLSVAAGSSTFALEMFLPGGLDLKRIASAFGTLHSEGGQGCFGGAVLNLNLVFGLRQRALQINNAVFLAVTFARQIHATFKLGRAGVLACWRAGLRVVAQLDSCHQVASASVVFRAAVLRRAVG